MIKKMLKNKTTVLIVLIALVLLACIRLFESKLFYDPFIAFFKSEYFHKPLPNFASLKLFLNILFRYSLNSIISIVIIYTLFANKGILKITVYLYVIIGLILIILLYVYLNSNKPDYMIVFYLRRFLIQPLLLLLFVPAFYYQKTQNKSLT
uniref:exosortase F system-associated membrane protein n=1 Tax=Flavobacterium sp. TaxID=239 RepID=UPI0040492FBC